MPFMPKAVEGIFMGYHFDSYGKWTGDYEVCDLDLFRQMTLKRDTDPKDVNIGPERTAKVCAAEKWKFPLKEHFDATNKSVDSGKTLAERIAMPPASGDREPEPAAEPIQPFAPQASDVQSGAGGGDILGTIDIKKPFP